MPRKAGKWAFRGKAELGQLASAQSPVAQGSMKIDLLSVSVNIARNRSATGFEGAPLRLIDPSGRWNCG